ncbi:MAG: tyrosine-type recombinase/integrase [Halobacteriales archaeon]|nr:tyrosine-type recombinase/integrase [Halobacteriales archaeon]
MAEEKTPAQVASQSTESSHESEPSDTSTAGAKIVIRWTAHNNHWLTHRTWDAPYVTHYGASSIRLMPQPANDAFIEENQAILEKWDKDAQARGLAEATVSGYRSNLRRFAAYLGPRSLIPVRSVDLQGYTDFLKATTKAKAETLSSHFTALSSLYDYLADEGLTGSNPVPLFRNRHLAVQLREANKKRSPRRQLLKVDEMSLLVQSMSDVRDRAMTLVLAKTGVRCGELVAMDVKDIDWSEQSIEIKPFPKRTHLTAFFDAETESVLRAWLEVRAAWTSDKKGPLFVAGGERVTTDAVGKVVSAAAHRLGKHDPTGSLRFRFTPHACRHWFTTHLLRAGMKESFVQILRGDSPGRSMDIYNHIDWAAVRKEYLRHIPKLLTERQRRRAAALRAALAATALPSPIVAPATRQAVQPAAKGGSTPSMDRLELRKLITEDRAAGRLRRPSEYSRWLQTKTARRPKAAMQMVLREFQWLRKTSTPGPGTNVPQTQAALAPEARPAVPARRRNEAPPATVELRRMLAEDLAAGRLRRTGEYGSWLQEKSGRGKASARETVRQCLRALGVPAAPRPSPRPKVPLPLQRGLPAVTSKASIAHHAGSPTKSTSAQPDVPRNATRAKATTVALRELLAADLAAGRLREPADYLVWLKERTGTSLSAAGNIVRRELRALLLLPPLATRTPVEVKDTVPKAVAPSVRDPRTAWRTKPGSGGRKPNPETVRLREALQGDAVAQVVRPRQEYLAILATGAPKARHTALHIVSREAKRILGRPLKA